mgnify:CR=1 FL=1
MCDRKRGLEGKTESAEDVLLEDLAERVVRAAVDLGRRLEELVARQLAQALGATNKDGRLELLGPEEEEDDEGESRDPEELEERPAVVLAFGRKAADDRAGDRSADGSDG